MNKGNTSPIQTDRQTDRKCKTRNPTNGVSVSAALCLVHLLRVTAPSVSCRWRFRLHKYVGYIVGLAKTIQNGWSGVQNRIWQNTEAHHLHLYTRAHSSFCICLLFVHPSVSIHCPPWQNTDDQLSASPVVDWSECAQTLLWFLTKSSGVKETSSVAPSH